MGADPSRGPGTDLLPPEPTATAPRLLNFGAVDEERRVDRAAVAPSHSAERIFVEEAGGVGDGSAAGDAAFGKELAEDNFPFVVSI